MEEKKVDKIQRCIDCPESDCQVKNIIKSAKSGPSVHMFEIKTLILLAPENLEQLQEDMQMELGQKIADRMKETAVEIEGYFRDLDHPAVATGGTTTGGFIGSGDALQILEDIIHD